MWDREMRVDGVYEGQGEEGVLINVIIYKHRS